MVEDAPHGAGRDPVPQVDEFALDSAVDHPAPALAACFLDRAKVLRLDVLREDPRSVVAAISVTRRVKKAR